jgi:lipopolysaccharide/colanic/teichoic acid biosynthesis glycosyltransferase
MAPLALAATARRSWTLKRGFDLLATVGVLLLWPVLLVIAIAIRFDDSPPVFFRQERVGRRQVPFRIWKFRSMRTDAACAGSQLIVDGDPHVTRVGRVLWRTKLDELPQLFNVLAGEISLIGPRPEVTCYVAAYTDAQRVVLELTPGITDPASLAFVNEEMLLAQAADATGAGGRCHLPLVHHAREDRDEPQLCGVNDYDLEEHRLKAGE